MVIVSRLNINAIEVILLFRFADSAILVKKDVRKIGVKRVRIVGLCGGNVIRVIRIILNADNAIQQKEDAIRIRHLLAKIVIQSKLNTNVIVQIPTIQLAENATSQKKAATPTKPVPVKTAFTSQSISAIEQTQLTHNVETAR